MVAPVNRLTASPLAPSRRAAVLDDTTFDTILALRALLAHDDPKVVLAAAKLILDYEKARLRHGKQLVPSEPAGEVAVAPRPVAAPPEPHAEPDADRRPPAPPRLPPFDCGPLGSASGGGRRGGALQPSIASFLPPSMTGDDTATRPTPPA